MIAPIAPDRTGDGTGRGRRRDGVIVLADGVAVGGGGGAPGGQGGVEGEEVLACYEVRETPTCWGDGNGLGDCGRHCGCGLCGG